VKVSTFRVSVELLHLVNAKSGRYNGEVEGFGIIQPPPSSIVDSWLGQIGTAKANLLQMLELSIEC